MCDYSLMHVKSRPARLATSFERRISEPAPAGSLLRAIPAPRSACCPARSSPSIRKSRFMVLAGLPTNKTAIFRQINREQPHMHYDAA
jgi:hypothetical protein